MLLACEDAAAEIITAQAPKTRPVTIEDQARHDPLDLLTDPQLVDRSVDDLAAAGIVGEMDNLLVGYPLHGARRRAPVFFS